ncbi:hypothetical protein HDU93_001478, partial [Gonapodya sp. JEL0774]
MTSGATYPTVPTLVFMRSAPLRSTREIPKSARRRFDEGSQVVVAEVKSEVVDGEGWMVDDEVGGMGWGSGDGEVGEVGEEGMGPHPQSDVGGGDDGGGTGEGAGTPQPQSSVGAGEVVRGDGAAGADNVVGGTPRPQSVVCAAAEDMVVGGPVGAALGAGTPHPQSSSRSCGATSDALAATARCWRELVVAGVGSLQAALSGELTSGLVDTIAVGGGGGETTRSVAAVCVGGGLVVDVTVAVLPLESVRVRDVTVADVPWRRASAGDAERDGASGGGG